MKSTTLVSFALFGLFACSDTAQLKTPDAAVTVVDAPVVVVDAPRPPVDAPPATVVLGNVAAGCVSDQKIGPLLPDEAGHFGATTLTPPRYPFTVTSISYALGSNSGTCNAGVAHNVLVFKSTADKPSLRPTADGPITTLTVAAAADADRNIAMQLPTAITLNAGEKLIVAIQLKAAGNKSICISACPSAHVKQDWWSNAVAEPYAWADMVAEFGFASQFIIHASGR